ncbi:MAG: multicopper oxidase family protein [Sneathiella sp.]
MSKQKISAYSRRKILTTSAGLAVSAALPNFGWASTGSSPTDIRLVAAAGKRKLDPAFPEASSILTFNGSIPGPEIRIPQGSNLTVTVDNQLSEATTVHWHGVRTPNAMDGVPYLTQKPILPQSSHTYKFKAIDAGTYWYHPHMRSYEQVGRGLYGSLIIEEKNPIRVDRDVTWMLDDWRLEKTGEIQDNFGNKHDMSHNGRIGNFVTINGKRLDKFPVQKGERLRLRLINAANARIFALDFQGHSPVVIAMDGQPIEPHKPDGGLVILGPAMRIDLILDLQQENGSNHGIIDRSYKGLEYQLTSLDYATRPLRNHKPDWGIKLPSNNLPEPDIQNAKRHEVLFHGGMMGGMILRNMGIKSTKPASMMGMMHSKNIWYINGVAAEGSIMDPMLKLDINRSHILQMTNATAWHHPIHLHGHSFKVLTRNGKPTKYQEWQDTVIMAPKETVEIAFVADNPGDWMFHCHILEHAASGMMGVIRVA